MSALATVLAMAVMAVAQTTSITVGPVADSGLATPTFEFTADGASGFECSLDDAPFSSCASPQKLGPLVEGAHKFAVRAVAADGSVEDPPAVRRWTYVPSPLGAVAIKLNQPAKAKTARKSFTSISGTAVSTTSRVTSVQVAIQTGRSDKDFFPPRCHFFDVLTGAPIFRTCVLPPFRTVQGTTNWRYTVRPIVRKRLRPGDYTIIVRAFNAFSQATRRDFKFSLR